MKKVRVNITIDESLINEYRSEVKGNLSSFINQSLEEYLINYRKYKKFSSVIKEDLSEEEFYGLMDSIGYLSSKES